MNRTIQNKFVVGIKHSNTYGILVLVILFITSNLYSQTVPYSSLYTNATFVKTINTNLAVGVTAGSANQNNGAANYSIPLSLPQGTNDVSPKVTMSYNSIGSNGPMGLGWNFSGQSMISRTTKSIYLDGVVQAVEITSNDKFTIDGERLISKTGTYGNDLSTYGKEIEDFSTITSYGSLGGGPQYFKVETKDGLVIEYGNSTDSRFLNAGGTTLYWKLNKIIYKDGNYIEYKYITTNDEILLSEINYTGNASAGLLPYNKVKFNYLQREDKTTIYEKGTPIKSGYLLTNITITTEGNVAYKTYNLKYAHDNINSFLIEVQELGSDGGSLNTTIFKYGDQTTGFQKSSLGIVAGSSVDLFSGDFDADGYSDFLAADYAYNSGQKYHTGFKIYKRTSTSSTYSNSYTKTFPANEYFKIVDKNTIANGNSFMTADFDGDGDDDLMVAKYVSTSAGWKADRGDLYISDGTGSAFTVTNINFPDPPAGSSQEHFNPDGRSFNIGDFNGDGMGDFLFMNIYNQNNAWQWKVYASYGGSSPLSSWSEVTCAVLPNIPVKDWVEVADKIYIIDFDGDSKSDLLIIDEGDSEIFTFESNLGYSVKKIHGAGFPTKWHLLYFADFNGDKKTDILTRTSTTNINYPWYKAINTGSGFVETPHTFNHLPKITGSYSDDKLIFSDFNSDGKQDIYHAWDFFVGSTATTSRLDMYYSKGDNFYYLQHSNNSVLGFVPNIVFDLNGDGRPDIVNRNHYLDPFDIFYFKKEGQENILQKIKNGIDYVVEFTYKRLTQTSNFYTRGASGTQPVNNIQIPFYLVSQMKTENGIGGFSQVDFRYEEGKLHKEGKGFMGFKKITSIDATSGYTTTQENEFNLTHYIAMPLKTSQILTSTNALLKEVTNTNQFINLGSKRFWPRVNSSYENKSFEGQFLSNSFSYDSYGNITNSTINNNNVETKTTNLTYGQHGTPIPAKVTSTTESNVRTGQTAFNKTTTFAYNTLGQLTSKVEFSGLPKAISHSFTYNSTGSEISKTISASGLTARTSSQVFDSKGRFPTTITNVLGQNSTVSYDVKWGKPTSVTGVDGLITTYTYDAFGRLLTTTMPQGYAITNSYGWDINAVEGTIHYALISHPGKPNSKTWFDILNREKIVENEAFGSTWTKQKTTYDFRGNVSSKTQPYKSGEAILTNTNSYDTYNRLFSVVNTIGTTSYNYTYSGGNLTTTTTNPSSQINSKVSDATGKTISAMDYGATLNYTYFSNGLIKDVKNGSITLSSFEYDEYARQTKLTDINAGITQYTTDAIGQITSIQTANGQINNFAYDIFGRKTYHGRSEGSTTFTYYASGSGGKTNMLNTISNYGSITESYLYDTYGRVTTKNETIDGILHQTLFSYNTYNDVTSQTYPDGFVANYNYDSNGFMSNIKNGTNTITIYTNNSTNGLNQSTSYTLGNGKTSTNTYYFGTPTNYSTPGVQNLTLTWNYSTGNLTSRSDAIKSKTESFTYDNLNRLLTSSGTGIPSITSAYSNNGNINNKTEVGLYLYSATKINAVTNVANSSGIIPSTTQNITYSSFFQPLSISEGIINVMNFTYGHDDQRIKTVRLQNGVIVNTRYYFGEFEKDITSGTTRGLHYIYSPSGLICIVERIGTVDTYHYTYTDHINSILTVTNSAGTIEAEQNFDPWGRNRNATTWTYSGLASPPAWLYRGFTFHEHLPIFNLINMNGRLYDPIIGRMLSPDNNVQMPEYSQNYNRYSYALNNPLRFTDPDGEFLVVDSWLIGFVDGFFSKGSNRFSNAWKGANQMAWNDIKIWGGLFVSDRSKSTLGQAWEIISRFTWQLPQTIGGFLSSHATNNFGHVTEVEYFAGSTVVKGRRNGWGAITMGSYIIGDATISEGELIDNDLFRHEYGHYLQSQSSGPLYLFKYGLPSLTSPDPHRTFWTETDANKRASDYFTISRGITNWNNGAFPTATTISNPKWWEYPLFLINPFIIWVINDRRPR